MCSEQQGGVLLSPTGWGFQRCEQQGGVPLSPTGWGFQWCVWRAGRWSSVEYVFIYLLKNPKPTNSYEQMDHNNGRRFTYNGRERLGETHNLIYSSLDDPKSQMHKLAVKQPHESLIILSRYRTIGHNARIFYCMGETAIVHITVVILLTARKTGRSGGHTPHENWSYVKYRHYHCDRKTKMHTNSGVIKSRFQHESVCVHIGKRNVTLFSSSFFLLFFLVKYIFIFYFTPTKKKKEKTCPICFLQNPHHKNLSFYRKISGR